LLVRVDQPCEVVSEPCEVVCERDAAWVRCIVGQVGTDIRGLAGRLHYEHTMYALTYVFISLPHLSDQVLR
jgi:hypothetical protein